MAEDVGRPTVMTPEVLRKLEEAFLLGCSDLEACFVADISKTALYEYQSANPEFAERKEKLKENPIYLARTSVVNSLKEDGDLALRFLERRKKDEFSTKQETEHSGNIGIKRVERVIVNSENTDSTSISSPSNSK